jgi:hypothetical protein
MTNVSTWIKILVTSLVLAALVGTYLSSGSKNGSTVSLVDTAGKHLRGSNRDLQLSLLPSFGGGLPPDFGIPVGGGLPDFGIPFGAELPDFGIPVGGGLPDFGIPVGGGLPDFGIPVGGGLPNLGTFPVGGGLPDFGTPGGGFDFGQIPRPPSGIGGGGDFGNGGDGPVCLQEKEEGRVCVDATAVPERAEAFGKASGSAASFSDAPNIDTGNCSSGSFTRGAGNNKEVCCCD